MTVADYAKQKIQKQSTANITPSEPSQMTVADYARFKNFDSYLNDYSSRVSSLFEKSDGLKKYTPNAIAVKDEIDSETQELLNMQSNIMGFMSKNKQYFDDAAYNSVIFNLQRGVDTLQKNFNNVKARANIYSKYESEDDYNTVQKVMGYDYKGFENKMAQVKPYSELEAIVNSQIIGGFDPENATHTDPQKINTIINNYVEAVSKSKYQTEMTEYLAGKTNVKPIENDINFKHELTMRIANILNGKASEQEKISFIAELNKEYGALLKSIGFDSKNTFSNAQKEYTENKNAYNQMISPWYQITSEEDNFNEQVRLGKQNSQLKALIDNDKTRSRHLTDYEKDALYYVGQTQGYDAALRTFSNLDDTELIARDFAEEVEERSAWATDNWFNATLAAIGNIIVSNTGGLANNIAYMGSVLNPGLYNPGHKEMLEQNMQYGTAAGYSAVEQNVRKKYGGVIYDTLYAIGDNGFRLLSSALLSGGLGFGSTAVSKLSAIMSGGNIMGEATYNAIQNGATPNQALAQGFTQGLAEYLGEKFSFDSLLSGGKGLKQFIVNALSEGLGELATSAMGTVFDYYIMKDESEFAKSISRYKDDGLSDKEAFAKAFTDTAKNVFYEGLIGLLVGAGMSVTVQGINKLTSKNLDNANDKKKYAEFGNTIKATQDIRDINAFVDALAQSDERFANILKKTDGAYTDEAIGIAYQAALAKYQKYFNDVYGVSDAKNLAIDLIEKFEDTNNTDAVDTAHNKILNDLYNTYNQISTEYGEMYGNNPIIKSAISEVYTNNVIMVEGFAKMAEAKSSKQNSDITAEAESDAPGIVEGNIVVNNNELVEVDDEGNEFYNEAQSEADSMFTERSAAAITDSGNLTDQQVTIRTLGKALGYNISFDDVRTKSGKPANAKVNGKNITFNYNITKPIEFLLKHEITHSLEKVEGYADFQNMVMESRYFANWVNRKGFGDVSEMRQSIIEKRVAVGDENFVGQNSDVQEINANNEITANFVGEVFFGGKNGLTAFVETLTTKQRKGILGFLQRVYEYVRDKITKYKYSKTNQFLKNLDKELADLHRQFAMLYQSAKDNEQQKTTDTEGNGGVKYNIEFENATVNEELFKLIKKVETGNYKANEFVNVGTVSESQAIKLKKITGLDLQGYNVKLEARQIHHIINQHGKNGKTDNSMEDASNIAKIGFALNNADDIRKSGKTSAYSHTINGYNKTADTVLYEYEKAVGDKSYYIVETAVDTKSKTLYIVSAFIGNKGYKKETSQLIDAKSPNATSKDGSVVVSNTKIPQNDDGVNTYSMQDTEKYSLDDGNKSNYNLNRGDIDDGLEQRISSDESARSNRNGNIKQFNTMDKERPRTKRITVSGNSYEVINSSAETAEQRRIKEQNKTEFGIETYFGIEHEAIEFENEINPLYLNVGKAKK